MNVWVAELPMVTLPNGTVVVGATAMSTRATPLATAEHALSLPLVSTAVTATLLVKPVVKPVRRKLTV